jgi:predicted ATPase
VAHLLGIQIKNYKALADVTLGKVEHGRGDDLPGFACFIGPNGSGKSSLLDAFGFLADSLRDGVEAACDQPHRGGFERLRTQGRTGPISFKLYFRQTPSSRPITYTFAVDTEDGVPVVTSELLQQRRKGQKSGRPFPFLRLQSGEGDAWSGEMGTEGGEASDSIRVQLDDRSRLGITTLGQLKEHPRIVGLRTYLEGWYLSYFLPTAARTLPSQGAQKHLDRTGENLGNYVQYLQRTYPDRFASVLARVSARIPGIRSIDHEVSRDRRVLLQFNERGYNDPFFQNAMSDGTLKLFAYLLLLEDPEPRSFIGIEEPENGLYHKLLATLAREFKDHALQREQTQVFVTTHSPYLVDALEPTEVWLVQRNDEGTVDLTRTDAIPGIAEMVSEGLPLGSLWYSDHLHERGF